MVMKMTNRFCVLTSTIIAVVANNISAQYSPTWVVKRAEAHQEKNQDRKYYESYLHQLRQRIHHQHSRREGALCREFHQHPQRDHASDAGQNHRGTEADRKHRPPQEAEIQDQDQ